MANLLIKEKSTSALTLNESVGADGKKKFIFEGIFTPCDGKTKNRNGRIYDESEVLKHLAYLREKIKNEGCILGELDHPEGRFEVYLKDVSHKITDLWYDPSKKAVMGKLELLDTPNGKTMKAIVEGGCPLYVSSRAAGTVNPDSHVSIQQIFTYDIVATPGFAQCKLDQISESMRPVVTSFINESINTKKSDNQAAKYGILDENVEIIETDEVPEITEGKHFDYNNMNLTKPLVNEDVQVKVSPEKAQELGLTGVGTDNPVDDTADTNAEPSREDIINIIPTYAGEGKDEIMDVQPEFSGAENEPDTRGAEASTQNPFESMVIGLTARLNEGCNKKKDEEKKTPKPKDDNEETVDDISEQDKEKANHVKDGKLNSEADKIEKSTHKKEEKEEVKSGATNDEDVKKLEEQKKEVQESAAMSMKYYQDIINEAYKKQQIRNSIIAQYPFANSLTESNFIKFAQLLDDDKMAWAEYIWKNQIWEPAQINEQFMRPLIKKVNEAKNYIRLADDSDLELYNNASDAQRQSIDEMAKIYILENKADVDEFWRRTGLRDQVQMRINNESFVQNYVASGTEEDSLTQQYGYNIDFIKHIGELM